MTRGVQNSNGAYDDRALSSNYQVGTRFNIQIRASSTGIRVDYNNGVVRTLFAGRRASSALHWYFKAGRYLQANALKGRSLENTATHSSTT